MYTVQATNHFNDTHFEQSYLSKQTAVRIFNTATKCVDCKEVIMIDALTGCILLEWDSIKGLVWVD